MKERGKPRVKICCIKSVEEARLAIEMGADAIGLVSAMPSGPGPIPEELIAEIAAQVPPPIGCFLLTCRRDVESIIDQQRRVRVNTIQICDRLAEGSYDDLRRALPGVSLVQVIPKGQKIRACGKIRRTSSRCHVLIEPPDNP